MMRKLRKGFTIVELVIVIAVIAVLTAILVPTFVHLSKKAKESSDKSLVHNLNTALTVDTSEGNEKPVTMHDAVEALDRQGYGVTKLVTKSEQDLVYSIEENKFYLSDEVSGDHKDFWHIEKSMPTVQDWSIYAYDWSASERSVSGLTVGFDSGDVELDSISYARQGSASDKRTTLIRTNSYDTELSVDAAYDTINHHGKVGKVLIDKIDMNCYNERGKAAYIKVNEGAVVAKDGGSISVVFAANNDGSKVAVIEDNGTIDTGLTAIQPVSEANEERQGGIALEYSIDGSTAAIEGKTEEELSALLEEKAEASYASSDEVIENVITEEVIEEGGKDSKVFAARIGEVGYESFEDALVAARGTTNKIVLIADEIALERDTLLTNEVVVTKDTSIDLSYYKLSLGMSAVNSSAGYVYTYGKITSNNHELTFTGSNYYAGVKNVHLTEDMLDIIANAGDSLVLSSDLTYDSFGLDGNNNFEKKSGVWESVSSVEIGFDVSKTVFLGTIELEDGATTNLILNVAGLNYSYNWQNTEPSPFVSFPDFGGQYTTSATTSSPVVTIKANGCGFNFMSAVHAYVSCSVLDSNNDLVMTYSWEIVIPVSEFDWDL